MQTVIETKEGWMIHCVNCGHHIFPKACKPGATWTFNKNMSQPTFTPSMNEMVLFSESIEKLPDRRCHFTITNGQMHFHGDCTHEYVGKTLPLEPWSEPMVHYYESILKE